MGLLDTIKAQLTGTKLVFNVLFHGLHIGLFALGWYATPHSYPAFVN
jgi:NADPH oxidase